MNVAQNYFTPPPLVTRAPKERDVYYDKLKESLGLEIYQQTTAHTKILGQENHGDHYCYDMTMDTEPGVTMPFFLLSPIDLKNTDTLKKLPIVIVPHGHGSDGRYGVAGLHRHVQMEHNINHYHHDIGRQFVRQGYLVLCPDSRGSGDRREPEDSGLEPEQLKKSSCQKINNLLINQGSCLAGAWVWDLMKLIDLLLQQNWGDASRLGVCGFSGGGLQSLYLSAMDERIKCTAVSGYLHYWEDSFFLRNMCGCNFIPGINKNMNMADVACLIAPRSLILEKGKDDPLSGRSGIEGPRRLAQHIRSFYQGINKDDNFAYTEFEGSHQFGGEQIFPFFQKHLQSEEA
ncbi:dienelactone hydrolase family protein [Spirochaeta cellobiosiphila]|uniref:dienelactone hydrolase family protein n=1 Tax=Spirochaeta cellobiosiphila TaxID=504483 RepID=UPI000421E55E|nr:dienelactone hydrolase family protein [Spirochaeta cellobiosiphila]